MTTQDTGLDWGDMYDRADGSHMTQMDVDGGRTLTIGRVGQTKLQGKNRVELFWVEDVLPWLMPQQEALLLKAIGWSPSNALGRRLYLERDPKVKFGPDVVGGSRIQGSPDIGGPLDAQWRCGTKTLRRKLRKSEDPDPLWGLVVVRLGLPLDVVEGWAASKGRPLKLAQMNQVQRAQVAAKLDTEENRAALVAFANNQQKKDGE
jgi:hypothetical protein